VQLRNEDLPIPVELVDCASSISTRPKKPGTFIDTLRLDFLRVLIHGHGKQGTLCSSKYRQHVHGKWCIRGRSLFANKQVHAVQRATTADPSLRRYPASGQNKTSSSASWIVMHAAPTCGAGNHALRRYL